MSIVNFTIPKTLEKRVERTIKEKGFASKAEFFRMAAIHFVEEGDPKDRLSRLSDAVAYEVRQKYRGRKIPSLKNQLDSI